MDDFDLNLLRVLVALDNTRNVTRAALELNMSQSGFSTALARLRLSLDDPLFVRASRGMEPTARAKVTIETARQVLAQVRTGVLDQPVFDPRTARAEFGLAMADVAEIAFLPRLLKHLQRVAPQVTLHSDSWRRDDLRDAMESGRVDLSVGYFPDLHTAGFFSQRLYTHTYACMLRPRHRALKALSEQVYAELGHAVVASPSRSDELFEHFLERRHVERRVVLRTPHHLSLPSIIEKTDLIATVPLATGHRFAQAGMVELARLPFDPPLFEVRQYWHRRGHQDGRMRWLQAQMNLLFNDDTDEWQEIEVQLYGSLRKRAAGVETTEH
jgi:DNA-binding transcriptional LysR family regulator